MDIRMKSVSEDLGLTLSYDTEIYLVGTEQLIKTHYPFSKGFFLGLIWVKLRDLWAKTGF